MDKTSYIIRPLGETGLIVTFGDQISPQIHKKVKNLADYIEKHSFSGFYEYVISYTSVAVFYNPFIIKNENAAKDKTAYKIVSEIIESYITAASRLPQPQPHTVEIPVCYGGDYGPDISFVADHNKLAVDEVIEIHSQNTYLVYMIGFCPGFPYLGGMDERIATPRRAEPRLSIPAGSIGIAGKQTGGYPISTPGGWQLIGRTPIDLFRPDSLTPSLLHSGDMVKFISISPEKYQQLKGDKS
ncbi:5-oxoprolinase subunit PxpB [Pectinatus haikarae]|uniref:Inhibitor of KinA n=1 Tax=Pectinatus haikarae TaxID=349096 RepID=A0ABT9YAK1_9FIRM|nr:5-oxoprolinase subunit PxpB [Pectinatus haikarae]MDQ0204673.1 inhibitor of KinA [Pectinatus haikarae]